MSYRRPQNPAFYALWKCNSTLVCLLRVFHKLLPETESSLDLFQTTISADCDLTPYNMLSDEERKRMLKSHVKFVAYYKAPFYIVEYNLIVDFWKALNQYLSVPSRRTFVWSVYGNYFVVHERFRRTVIRILGTLAIYLRFLVF